MDKKKKFRELIPKEDYWVGMAFCFGAMSFYKRQAAIIVDSHNLISYGLEIQPNGIFGESDHLLSSEIHAISNSKIDCQNSVIYLTHTPNYSSILNIVNAGIKRIVYFNTKKLCDDSLDLVKKANISMQEFRGNLNWMKDYMKILEDSGIFNLNHK